MDADAFVVIVDDVCQCFISTFFVVPSALRMMLTPSCGLSIRRPCRSKEVLSTCMEGRLRISVGYSDSKISLDVVMLGVLALLQPVTQTRLSLFGSGYWGDCNIQGKNGPAPDPIPSTHTIGVAIGRSLHASHMVSQNLRCVSPSRNFTMSMRSTLR